MAQVDPPIAAQLTQPLSSPLGCAQTGALLVSAPGGAKRPDNANVPSKTN